jgi:hypothetical protein
MDTPDISGVSEGIKNSAKANIDEQTADKEVLPACTIGISISDSPDLDSLGFTNLHVQDTMVEITRYLLVNNCNLIYGGDLRKDGFTYIFSELAKQYSNPKNYDTFRVANYFAWPIHINLSRVDDSEFKANNIQVVKLPPPQGFSIAPNIFIKPDNLQNKVIWAKSLSEMRQTIAQSSNGRILIGGQVMNYMGIIPGLVEEALNSIRSNQPLYLCGAFGGATKEIINAIFSGNTQYLTDDFQFTNEMYKSFYTHWNETETIKINYPELIKEFHDFGITRLSAGNGLNEEENQRLALTQHIPEMIYLVMKGLKTKMLLG